MNKLYKWAFFVLSFIYILSMTFDGVIFRQAITMLFLVISLLVILTNQIKFSFNIALLVFFYIIVFCACAIMSPNPDWKLKIFFIFSSVAFLLTAVAIVIIDYKYYFLHFAMAAVIVIICRLVIIQDENFIFYNASRNIVATYILIPFISIFLLCHKNKEKMWVALICFTICFLLKGRTAILLSGVLMLVALYRCFGFKGLLSAIFLLSPLLLYANYSYIDQVLIQHTNFSEGLKTTRSVIYAEYFDDFSLVDLIFGRSFDGMPIINILNNNPHNSFLLLHSLYGIVPTFFAVLFFIVSTIKIKNRMGLLTAIVFALIPVKAMTDSVLFFNILDIFYLLLLLYLLNERRSVIYPSK